MSANLTAEQTELMLRANAAALAGFGNLASSLAETLRRSLESNPASKPRHGSQTGGNRSNYGRFKLNEADECALEVVESPDHRINAAGDES